MVTLTADKTSSTIASDGLKGGKLATGNGLTDRVKWALAHAKTVYAINAERRQLLKLTDDELNDVGITRAQVQKECKRSIFDIPKR